MDAILPRRPLFISATAQDLDWVSQVVEQHGVGVEITDFAQPTEPDSSRERVFELWHLWREAATAKVPMAMHAPFLDLVPGSLDPEMVEFCRKQHAEALTLAGALGVGRIIFHSGFNPLIRGPQYFEPWLNRTVRYFSELIAQNTEFTFLLENMWEPTPDPLIKVVDRINSPNLRICFDVGHALIWGRIPPEEWLPHIGLRLGHVHLNDNDGTWDQERPLGAGVIPHEKILGQLNALGFFGPIGLEMRGQVAIQASLDWLKRRGQI